MKHDWKPGDVVYVPGVGLALRRHGGSWFLQSGTQHSAETFAVFDGARPLVVIDPEDREAIDRFMALEERLSAQESIRDLDRAARIQVLLREFADPTPEPAPEPQDVRLRSEDLKWVAELIGREVAKAVNGAAVAGKKGRAR